MRNVLEELQENILLADPLHARIILREIEKRNNIQGGSNMTGTDLCVKKPHCAEAVRP